MAEFDVLAVGDLCPDLILAGIRAEAPRLGTEQEFARYELTLGGSTSIACVLMRRLGLRTAMVARVGADEYGRFCRETLAAEGVDVEHIRDVPGTPTGVTIALPYPQDRMLLTCYGTMEVMEAGAVDDGLLDRCQHVHSGSFFIQRRLRPGLAGLFARARAKGRTTSLDTGWDPDGRWMDGDLAAALAQTDVFFPNEMEFAQLAGTKDIDAGLARLRGLGVREVVLKRGARGAVYAGPEGVFEHKGFAVAAVDTTGAGDACNAGYLAARLAGLAPMERLAFANACGAMTVTALGGTGGLASRAAVETFLAAIAARG